MNFADRNKLFEKLYHGFFARTVTTPKSLLRAYRYTNLLIAWLTTSKTEKEICKSYGTHVRTLQLIKKHCETTNPTLYQKCYSIRHTNMEKKGN
jgi:hypothetical protein